MCWMTLWGLQDASTHVLQSRVCLCGRFFCGLPFKRFVPKSVAQEKVFKVMDALDAQARTCGVLFLRGAM